MIMCQLEREDDEKEEKDMWQCCNVLILAEPMARDKRNQRRKEGAAQPLHHACQACHNHTQGCTADSQYLWRQPQ